MDKKELAILLNELGKSVKQEKSPEYINGYIDGIMDFHNEVLKKSKEYKDE
jgi:hypothetical protein